MALTYFFLVAGMLKAAVLDKVVVMTEAAGAVMSDTDEEGQDGNRNCGGCGDSGGEGGDTRLR